MSFRNCYVCGEYTPELRKNIPCHRTCRAQFDEKIEAKRQEIIDLTTGVYESEIEETINTEDNE